jgi:hypothetical protein
MSKSEYPCLAEAAEKAIISKETDTVKLCKLLLMCTDALRTAAAEKPTTKITDSYRNEDSENTQSEQR